MMMMMMGFALSAQPASDYTVRHFDVSNGLSNEWIADIEQDEAGFLWIATQYGLNRFDGKTFTTYTYRPGDDAGPQANWTRKLLSVSPNELWLGTLGKGLAMMDTRRERFTPATQSGWANRTIVGDMLTDRSGRQWVSFGNALASLTPGEEPRISSGTRMYSMAETASGEVFGAGAEGIWRIDTERLTRTQISEEKAYTIHAIGNDSLLIAGARSVKLIVRARGHWATTAYKVAVIYDENPYYWPRFEAGPDGEIWLAMGKQVWSFSKDLKQSFQYNLPQILGESCVNCEVHEVFFDREESMWWGTDRGLFQLRKSPTFYGAALRQSGGKLAGVRELIVDGDMIWLARQEGLFVWDKTSTSPPRMVDEAYFQALHLGRDGMVYGVKQNALIRFNAITGERDNSFRPEGSLPEGSCWRIIDDRSDRIWIAKWDAIAVYTPAANRITHFKTEEKGEAISMGILDMMIDQEDNLWLGTMYAGLLKATDISEASAISAPEFESFAYDPDGLNSISSSLILQLHQTSNGTIWVATDGGLNQVLPGEKGFKRFLRSTKMPDDKILSMTSTETGQLWLGTISHGIMHFDSKAGEFRQYSKNEGLEGNTMMMSSIFQEADGTIWMGGQDGLQTFNPKEFMETGEAKAPTLVWTNLHRIGRDSTIENRFPSAVFDDEAPLLLFPNQHTISWDFSALTFKAPSSVRYHFKLEGFHSDWLPARADGHLTLSNLPRGDYQLRVAASNAEEGWRTEHLPIPLKIIPPWYLSTLALIAYGLLALGLLVFLYRSQLRRRLAEEEGKRIAAIAREKLSWFQRIAHEFRTPLTVIAGAVDRSRNGAPAEQEGQLKLIDQQTSHLNKQVGQILEMASLKAEGYRLHPQIGDFVAYQHYLLRSVTTLAEAKNIQLEFTASTNQLFFAFDEDAWRKITGNLLANAIKFTANGGKVVLEIRLKTERGSSEVMVIVKDTGRGIAPQFQARVFEPFVREDDLTPGTGLGLPLVKELATMMQGEVLLQSSPGKGSTFTAVVPLGNYQSHQLAVEQATEEASVEKPLLVVAEDHPEVLDYIVYCLGNDYRFRTAADGDSAWELSFTEQPALVLTDMMMPGMSGLELVKTMRKNPATDHIPVILLTAKAGDQSRLDGLQVGVDAYLTKPFRREELLATVSNLIARQQQVWEKYQSGDFSVKPETEKLDAFVLSVVQIIEGKLAEEAFSVEELAKALHLSRTQLFRKLKTLTGQSPSLFIRRIRLAKAREEVLTTQLTIAEVAYRYGFKEPAYFSRVYREEFGESPSESRGNGNTE
jgi:signal transduction histidine kinase/DNA-binding response OmpR family regulator/ligand-binding sensor domain-containing protein